MRAKCAPARTKAVSAQRRQQVLAGFDVGCIEALGELLQHRLQKLASAVVLPARLQQGRHVGCGAQLPGAQTMRAAQFERLDETRRNSERVRATIESAALSLRMPYRDRLIRRLRLLLADATEDDYGETLSPESLQGLLSFLRQNTAARYPDIMLTPEGFFRAEWHESDSSHLAITFLPGDDVRYVVFSRPPRARPHTMARIDRQSGITSADRVMEILAPFAIHRWVRD